jgi:hypothetical protein
MAHLGVHAGRSDHGTPASPRHRSAAEHHVDAVPQADRTRERRCVLEHRFALPRPRRLGHGERRGVHQAAVGRDRVALGQGEHVAGDDLRGGHPHGATVTQHACGDCGHALQRRHRLFGSCLLYVAQQGVGHQDERDDHDLEGHVLGALEQPRHQGHRHGHQEEVDERVAELLGQLAPCRHRLRRLQLVGPEAVETLGGLRPGQPPVDVGVEALGDGGRVLAPRLGAGRGTCLVVDP